MKLALIDDFHPALIVGEQAIDITTSMPALLDLPARDRMTDIIESFASIAPRLGELEASSRGVDLSDVTLRPPLLQPSKILCCLGNYREGLEHVSDLDMFLKAPSSIIGPNETIVFPDAEVSRVHHEAELAVVIGTRMEGQITPAEAEQGVFGYTGFIDVSGRGFGAASFIGKSFDTFGPLGPWITTRDEIPDPQNLAVKLSVDGELRQDYSTDDMEHPVTELVAWAAAVTTLLPGDLISTGTNHGGLGFLQDGERIEFSIEGIGTMANDVKDPRGRSWPKGLDYETIEIAKRWREGDHSRVNV
jgi:2-keto-4-pentenoate hydratase/2-oxohepta-3-ene-1,7-dioic acid hydratase in catechol pathway